MPSRPGGWVNQAGALGAIARFWQRSYAPDYVGVGIVLVAYMMIQFFVEPFHRLFSLDNRMIQYPHADVERVPVSWLFAYAVGVPCLVLLGWILLFRPGKHKVHVTFLGLAISLVLTSFLTDVIKNTVGRPRPDLLDRCKPREGTPRHTLLPHTICTQPSHHILHDGWRSFPSGHSSLAFSGLGYLSIFLSSQLHILHPHTNLIHILLCLIPLLAALLIAISRCEDYRHDVYDVTVGSALGLGVAYLSWRRFYPRLRSRGCETPFPGRGEREAGWKRVDDEEAGEGEEEEGMELAAVGEGRGA